MLDIGCGTGQTTRDAARAASAGSALGVDLSSQMLDHARRSAAAEGLTNAPFEQADAQIHPFDAEQRSTWPSAGRGRCSSAISSPRSPTSPGPSRPAAGCPGHLAAAGRQRVDPGALRRRSPPVATGRPRRPMRPDRSRWPTPTGCAAVLSAAGFTDIELDGAAPGMWFGTDVDDAHRFVVGLLGWMLEGLDDAGRARALDALRNHRWPPRHDRRASSTARRRGSSAPPGDDRAAAATALGELQRRRRRPDAAPWSPRSTSRRRSRPSSACAPRQSSCSAPRLGDRVVDVGCGTGDIARALAGLVGPTGRSSASTPATTMLAEARRRTGTSRLPVEFRPATSPTSDTPTAPSTRHCASVSSSTSSHPERAMAELVRVTRPGGRVVVIDTDWGMHAIHGADPDTDRKVSTAGRQHAANGLSGRRLPALFAAAGMPDHDRRRRDDDQHRSAAPAAAAVHHDGGRRRAARVRSPRRGRGWLGQLADAGRRGRFFWALTMFAVGATRA